SATQGNSTGSEYGASQRISPCAAPQSPRKASVIHSSDRLSSCSCASWTSRRAKPTMTVAATSRTSSLPRRGRDGIADRPLSDAGALIWSAHRPAVLSRHGVGGLLCLGVVPGPCAGVTLGPVLGGLAALGLDLLAQGQEVVLREAGHLGAGLGEAARGHAGPHGLAGGLAEIAEREDVAAGGQGVLVVHGQGALGGQA